MVSESVQRLMDEVDLDRARAATAGTVARTPTLASEELRELTGGKVALKCECLQWTGSFKLRGALSKVAALGSRAHAGLVTASAGNHGRAVAQAARIGGISCEVFMPRDAPVSKVAAVEELGAQRNLAGAPLRRRSRSRASARRAVVRALRSCTRSTTSM